jgi:hypothetical protein
MLATLNAFKKITVSHPGGAHKAGGYLLEFHMRDSIFTTSQCRYRPKYANQSL